MQNVIISNPQKLEKTKQNIKQAGFEKLQIVADFDRTLTNGFVNGEKIPSLISVLRDENYLSADYPEKAQALYDKYHSVEVATYYDAEEKKRLMHEWWLAHYDLLIKSGLKKSDLIKVASSKRIKLRERSHIFFEFLNERKIPLVILSAAGIGLELISLYLEKYGKLYDNVKIVSNEFIWDEDDKMIGAKEPIIHSANKNYSPIEKMPCYEDLKNRKNIILLGDLLSDIAMTNGFDFDNIIKIGFLNEDVEEKLADYQKKYDVVITDDGSMEYVNLLLKELV